MSGKIKKIALDVRSTSFMEHYRIQAYLGVIRYANENRSWRLLFNDRNFTLSRRFQDYEDLADSGVDGLIFYLRNDRSPAACQARALGLLAVNVAGYTEGHLFPGVMSDNAEIGRLGALHLIERGFRSFGFCGPSNWRWAAERGAAFQKTVLEAGHSCSLFMPRYTHEPEEEFQPYDHPVEEWTTPESLREWVDRLPKPAGVMGCHDQRALQTLEACQDMGLEVPADVAIVGVDNNRLICDACHPSLSSIDPDAERIGYQAAELLDRLLEGEKWNGKPKVVPPKGIIARMSSDILAVEDQAVARALVFIRDHLGEAFVIDTVARASRISRRMLERRFRARLGHTINSEIRRRRLEKAKSLMLDSMLTLEEIAAESGFKRSTYLADIFSAETGMSPGVWRRKHRSRK